MLVLSRKIGEVITIGNSISVTILSFDRGIVRVGIEAPKNITVHRKEVYDKIIEMNKEAAQSDASVLKSALSTMELNLNGSALNGSIIAIADPSGAVAANSAVLNGVHKNGKA